ncbi:MAG: NYN domain-containing protein [Pseudodesulfovibrio sp.]|uniref:NYN domain-containing protein n=1 Tax=Pseudodesulfovibrio sp. TaxID=2035812 RepID=UPI003D13A67E
MAEYVYVDNSNVYIEGKRVSAVEKGLSKSLSKTLDNNYAIDFGKLHFFVAGDNPAEIRHAVLFGSRPPKNDSLWEMARNAGFEVVIEDRNIANKEKKIDTGIVTSMMRDAYKLADPAKDTITLVSGDADYLPAIETLTKDGFRVDVVFWDHAAQELKDACSNFISLNPHLDLISYK